MQNNETQNSRQVIESIRPHEVKVSRLWDEAVRIHEKCADYMTLPNGDVVNTYYSPEENSLRFNYSDGNRSLPMSRYAFSQLCTKLGVPVRYVEQCFDKGRPDLASDNINAWLEDYNKPLFVREYDGCVRGILSDRYMVLDTHELLGAIQGVIDSSEYRVKGSFISPERFHARIVSPEPLPVGEGNLFAGFSIDSSDVGRSVISVGFMLYDKVCTNGMMVVRGQFDLFRRRHIGGGNDLFALRNDFKDAVSKIPSLLGDSSSLIAQALKAYNPVFGMKKPHEVKDEDVIRTLTRMRFSEEEAKKILYIMTNGRYDRETRWGLVGSITEAARDYTLERRLDMERIAGDILLGAVA